MWSPKGSEVRRFNRIVRGFLVNRTTQDGVPEGPLDKLTREHKILRAHKTIDSALICLGRPLPLDGPNGGILLDKGSR